MITAPLREFLSPEERLPKINVRTRARLSHDEIARQLDAGRFDVPALARACNRGALMIAMVGDLAEAERSCLRQLQVLAVLRHEPETATSALAQSFQPWINLGRLRVIQGRRQEAMRHFELARPYREDARIALGPLVLERADLDRLRDSEIGSAVRLFLDNVEVVESAKAYCRGKAFAELGGAAARWGRDERLRRVPHTAEAAKIAQAHGHGPGPLVPAPRPGADDEADKPTYAELVLGLHEAYRLHLSDEVYDRQRSRDLAEALRGHVPDMVGLLGQAAAAAPYLLRLGDLLRAQHRTDQARDAYARALELAREMADEALTVAALRALAPVEDPARTPELTARVEQLLARSLYLPLRKLRTGGQARPLQAADVSELRDLVAQEQRLVRAVAAGTLPTARD
ncbi:hypothetical protein [Actinomadura sp. WMMA1423]|uniref:hypothetical protein n=1 Tax=Actinomadura sp. WMMA1423 TaxID=2591108 RepID=UPI0011475F24|nr:hypothetical protein [Actinomadura sp. WMMA1423]